jgi:hypothetical protein
MPVYIEKTGSFLRVCIFSLAMSVQFYGSAFYVLLFSTLLLNTLKFCIQSPYAAFLCGGGRESPFLEA